MWAKAIKKSFVGAVASERVFSLTKGKLQYQQQD